MSADLVREAAMRVIEYRANGHHVVANLLARCCDEMLRLERVAVALQEELNRAGTP